MKMTKKSIIDNLHSETDLKREACVSAFESMLEIIKHELELGNNVYDDRFSCFIK